MIAILIGTFNETIQFAVGMKQPRAFNTVTARALKAIWYGIND